MSPFSARSKSAIRSSRSSMPTDSRKRSSEMPSDRRSSAVKEPWVIFAGAQISDSTPPSDTAKLKLRYPRQSLGRGRRRLAA